MPRLPLTVTAAPRQGRPTFGGGPVAVPCGAGGGGTRRSGRGAGRAACRTGPACLVVAGHGGPGVVSRAGRRSGWGRCSRDDPWWVARVSGGSPRAVSDVSP